MVRERYGAPLEPRELPDPGVGPAGVLVEVRAAGVDQGVWHLVEGLPYAVRLAGFGVRRPKHPVPGLDVAGVVAAVGQQVRGLAVGDEVFGAADGSFAQLATSDERRLARKPARISFAQAAIVASSGVAALQGLRDAGRLQPGERVLILGAGGGVGTFAVQIAVALGAEVTGVCSTAKTDLVRSLGAASVVDYTRGEPAGQWDLVLDTGGARTLTALRRLLSPTGTLVIVGAEAGGRWLQGSDRQLRAGLLGRFGRRRMAGLLSRVAPEPLETLRAMLDDGRVTPVVDRTFPLEQAAEAIAYMRAGQTKGKVALTLSSAF
ncbi:MAG TPA: NAD(P)-dependent alcohol dehydrogenase [Dactylosporangium sp.]|jgi:NADPH:quinone reductase-like Zn-dependent oxidoreductase|nr:NAD(P)-dependent alcohol dehydrogenase [Dactylosporangium sp.]